MAKKKILIIEDEKTICQELTELLTNEGYEAEYLEQFDNAKNDILEKNAEICLLLKRILIFIALEEECAQAKII